MPHYRKPFFKPKRNTWYVEVGRSQHTLGKHPDGLPPPKKRGSEWDRPTLDGFSRKAVVP